MARAVLDATVELWEGDGFANGAIDEELWATGYETMERLGFIDGSVPLEEMIVTDLGAAEALRSAASTSWRSTIIGVTGPMPPGTGVIAFASGATSSKGRPRRCRQASR